LPTYDFHSNDRQSTVILIRGQSQSMAPKSMGSKGPKLMHGYTPLIGPKPWLSTTGKMWMSSASTSVFYPLPHPQIRTSAIHVKRFARFHHTFNARAASNTRISIYGWCSHSIFISFIHNRTDNVNCSNFRVKKTHSIEKTETLHYSPKIRTCQELL